MGCSGNQDQNHNPTDIDPSANSTDINLSATWIGSFESSLMEKSYLGVELIQDGTILSGNFKDLNGREGTISGTLNGNAVKLSFIEATQNCSGEFHGSGVIDSHNRRLEAKVINFDFSGSDCLGLHSDGTDVLIMQTNEVGSCWIPGS